MRRHITLFILSIIFITIFTPASHANIEALIAQGATVKELASGFKFTEGPAVAPNGDIFFSDIPNETIHRYDIKEKTISLFRKNTGRGNGIYFDFDGSIILCEGGNQQLTKISMNNDVVVLTKSFNGRKYNSPNDCWIAPKGGIYFTDPKYGGKNPQLSQDGMHLYYLKPDRKTVIRVDDDLIKPNGVLGTPDGRILYVADHGGDKTYVYDINADGTLSNKKIFCNQGSDGMARDAHGNIYLTTDGVEIYSLNGKKLGKIIVPQRPANVVFGAINDKTLYITAGKGFYAIKMNVAGQSNLKN